MKLSEIVAEVKNLKDTIAGFIKDKASATDAALSAFSAKLTTLETGASAELANKTGELATASEKLTSTAKQLEAAQGEVTAINTALKSACTALKLEVKDGATAAEMIAAMQSGVTSTLAKLQIDPGKVPAGTPTNGAGAAAKKMSLDEEIKARQAANPTK